MVTCQIIDSINADKGGPSVSVTKLSDGLAALGVESHIFALDYPRFGPLVETQRSIVHTFSCSNRLQQALRMTPDARKSLIELSEKRMELLHSHGIWLPINRLARLAALGSGKPLITSIRGMLEPWARSHRALRKRLMWLLVEQRNVAAARVLHATSQAELGSLRALGLKHPVAVIANGTDLPRLVDPTPARGELLGRFPELEGRRILLFLGRLHPVKGIDLLLDAFQELRPRHPGWQLVIAGPDPDGLLRRKQQRAGVTITGALLGPGKDEILRRAELLVLPSRSESFGNVVAEALAYGVPVIASTATPWQDVERCGAGWYVPPRREALIAALEEALALDHAALAERGRRGRALAEQRYSWNAVCAEMLAVYQWMLGGGSPPPCVSL